MSQDRTFKDRGSLQNKTALVTGASRGIGRAIAVELAGAGARVYCVSTRAGGCDETIAACRAAGSAAAGGEAIALVADVSDGAQVEALAKTVLEAAPGLDILVNNAGVTKDGLFIRMTDADFDQVLAVNLRGTFLVCRAFARAMVKARTGRIVNVGSVVGLTGNAGQTNYAASKAGLVGLSKSLAKELGGRGITVNVVAPGFITTDMTSGLPEQVKVGALAQVPLGRFGVPEDVAAAVHFLSSDAAAYITGQVLVVDGGMAM